MHGWVSQCDTTVDVMWQAQAYTCRSFIYKNINMPCSWIPLCRRHGPGYSKQSISWLLIPCRRREQDMSIHRSDIDWPEYSGLSRERVNETGNSDLHDDVIKWKHFPRYWPFVRGIHRYPVNSPHKGQWRGALMFSLICAWINGWVNNREAGDLRRHRDHYDVIVMISHAQIASDRHRLDIVPLCSRRIDI